MAKQRTAGQCSGVATLSQVEAKLGLVPPSDGIAQYVLWRGGKVTSVRELHGPVMVLRGSAK